MCEAHTTVLEGHREAAALVVLLIIIFSAFPFCMFVILTILFLFLDASIVYVYNNLNRYNMNKMSGIVSFRNFKVSWGSNHSPLALGASIIPM